MSEPASAPPPLRRNRDFQLLWAGQVVSDLGARVSSIALPLLVVAVTGSYTKAGIVGFAAAIPLPLLLLPAGALVDRLDRKRVLIAADAARCLAFGSLALALWADRLGFGQLVAVGLVEGVGFTFFSVAERAALGQVVREDQLPAALAQNQARDSAALLGGQPLGGVLFGLGHAVPFVFDALSYLVSLGSLLAIRTRFQEVRTEARRRLHQEIAEGVRWLWGQPFLRTTSLLVLGSDFVLNALFLVVIALAKEHGASSTVVGATFAFLGVGGLLGAAVAPRLARRLPARVVVAGTMVLEALLVPLLAVVPWPLALGAIYGGMVMLHPTWNAVVGAYRIRITPDRLRGRVQSVATLLSLGSVGPAWLLTGFSIQTIGAVETVLVLFAIVAVVAVAALVSRSVREADLEG